MHAAVRIIFLKNSFDHVTLLSDLSGAFALTRGYIPAALAALNISVVWSLPHLLVTPLDIYHALAIMGRLPFSPADDAVFKLLWLCVDCFLCFSKFSSPLSIYAWIALICPLSTMPVLSPPGSLPRCFPMSLPLPEGRPSQSSFSHLPEHLVHTLSPALIALS